MEYFTKQIALLREYIGNTFAIFTNETGAIVLLIASVIVIVVVVIPRIGGSH